MIDTKAFKQENELWHREHAVWAEEVNQWQHETERLVALMYRLERAIPDYPSLIEHHTKLIASHEQRVIAYECGLDEHCLKTCTDYKTPEQQQRFHRELSELHETTRLEHERLKQLYIKEMKNFRALLLDLLKQSESLFDE